MDSLHWWIIGAVVFSCGVTWVWVGYQFWVDRRERQDRERAGVKFPLDVS